MMITKSKLASLTIFLTTIILITYTLTSPNNTNATSSFLKYTNFYNNKNQSPIPCRTLSPLKVYMYDLPPRFNFQMMTSSSSSSLLNLTENVPAWPEYAGLHQQHSVEYWMMTSLLCGVNCSEEVVRVGDGDVADVFYVPFFSSLSFDANGKNMTDPDTEIDRQLQVDILKFLRNSSFWQKNSGRDHVIPMHHPNAFRFLREEVNASILIVADFGRYSKSMSNLRKDVVAPYKHVVESYLKDDPPNPFKLRKTLLFFRGRTVRKSEGKVRRKLEKLLKDDPPNPFKLRKTLLFFRGRTVRKSEGKVRRKLEKLLKGYEDVHFEAGFATGEGINASMQGMRSSKYCLHPAGDTPSSNRLFDAIVSHCVPVIVSDHIELPFESELDYSKFALFFSVEEALIPGYMVEHLRKLPQDRWLRMWKRLKEITHHFEYQYPPKKDDAVNMIWRQVRTKVPAERLAVNRNQRLKIPDWW